MLHGIDVSNYQPADIAARVPNDFCLIRAGGGAGNFNAIAGRQLAAARAAGIQRLGLYHFAREGWTGTTPEQEAEHFLTIWDALADGDTLPVLDWEDDDLVHDVGWAKRWLDIVAAATGKTPLLYCNLGVATRYDWSQVQAMGVKLWLAWYLNDQRIDGYRPPLDEATVRLEVVEAGWDLALWQYAQRGRLPGYAGDLDLNVMYDDVFEINAPTDTELIPGLGI